MRKNVAFEVVVVAWFRGEWRGHEVVVVRVGAEPVALLGAVVGEDVDDAVLAQEGERAVDRREPRAGVALSEPCPELLRGRVVALAGQLLQHLEPARRRADALPLQQLRQLLRGGTHITYSSA